MSEIFVSIDVESDGPIPGKNSMLSFGAVAFKIDGTEVGSFSRNLELLPGAVANTDTEKFWKENQTAYDATRVDMHAPECAMKDFVAWAETLPGKPVAIAYPAGYDWTFIYWYLIKFAGKSPFGFQCLDIKSYAMAALKLSSFKESTKKNYPKEWFPEAPHTHIAIEDAREQGLLFINMLRATRGG